MDKVLVLSMVTRCPGIEVSTEQLRDIVVVASMVVLRDLMVMALWVTIMVAPGDLGITLSHYLSSATPCLNPEVANTILVLDSSLMFISVHQLMLDSIFMFFAVHQLMLDSVFMFIAVHLLIIHILFSKRLLEKNRFIIAEFQTNRLL